MTAYKDKSLHKRMIERQEYLERLRAPWESSTDKIIEYFRPDMFTFKEFKDRNEESTVDILGKKIYEGTGPLSLRLMQEGFYGNIIIETEPWFNHVLDEQELRGNDEVNEYLQEFDYEMYATYRNSSFYRNMPSFTRHGLSVGSPVVIPEENEDKGNIEFFVINPTIRYINQNRFGITDVLNIKEEWTIQKAVKRFGLNKFSNEVKYKYENGNEKEKIVLIRGIYFHLDDIFDDLPVKYKPRWPWVSIWIEQRTGQDGDDIEPLKMEGYWSKPFIVWHYEKDMSLIYSFTPAYYSYYDVQALMVVRKTLLKAGQEMIEPAWWAPKFLKGIAKFYPKGINWFQPAEKDMKPENLTKDIRFPDMAFELEKDIKETVRRWFYGDMWEQVTRLAIEKAQPVTAYQIMNIIGERATLLAPRVGNYLGSIKEIDDRIIEIKNNNGDLPIPPNILYEYSRAHRKSISITPEFIGPLAQVQKQHHSMNRIKTALEMAEPVFRIDPLTTNKIRAELLLEHILEENKLYQDVIKSDDEYKEILKSLAEQNMAEKAMALIKEGSDIVPKLSKTVEEGSPAEMMAR